MPTETLRRVLPPAVSQGDDLAAKVFMGYYTPFAGVRYYAILDELDILEARNKIGPVGCRGGTTSEETAPRTESPQ